MRVRLLYFAAVSDAVGKAEEPMDLPEGVRTLASLRALLAARYVALERGLASVRFARNETFAADTEVIEEGDVIALIPPVAGG